MSSLVPRSQAADLANLDEARRHIALAVQAGDSNGLRVARPAATVTHLHPGRPVTSPHDEALYARLADEIFPPGSAKP